MTLTDNKLILTLDLDELRKHSCTFLYLFNQYDKFRIYFTSNSFENNSKSNELDVESTDNIILTKDNVENNYNCFIEFILEKIYDSTDCRTIKNLSFKQFVETVHNILNVQLSLRKQITNINITIDNGLLKIVPVKYYFKLNIPIRFNNRYEIVNIEDSFYFNVLTAIIFDSDNVVNNIVLTLNDTCDNILATFSTFIRIITIETLVNIVQQLIKKALEKFDPYFKNIDIIINIKKTCSSNDYFTMLFNNVKNIYDKLRTLIF